MVPGYPARSLNANAASTQRLTLAEGGANGLRFPGQVAQLVEHVTENHGVDGSIPPLATIFHYKFMDFETRRVAASVRGHSRVTEARGSRARLRGLPSSGSQHRFAQKEPARR